MTPAAYYNEFDPYVAQWLRNLIAAGHIAPGDVDTRSIEDVHPDDLRGYTQHHFFAGLGGWSCALRRAGWPDSRRVRTSSCPCQPFSAAGAGNGFDDERHLWPAQFQLFAQLEPVSVFGEQVASKDADAWIDLVQTDMEALGYAFGAIAFPSAGIGAPHIRDRTYWVAHAEHCGRKARQPERSGAGPALPSGLTDRLADTTNCGQLGRLVHRPSNGGNAPRFESERLCDAGNPAGPTNGYWRDADWIGCTDGKWRPVEPGTQPLANGAAARVGRLRAYGNAINIEAAKAFIESYMELC